MQIFDTSFRSRLIKSITSSHLSRQLRGGGETAGGQIAEPQGKSSEEGPLEWHGLNELPPSKSTPAPVGLLTNYATSLIDRPYSLALLPETTRISLWTPALCCGRSRGVHIIPAHGLSTLLPPSDSY